jgi:hypothetical protein
MFGAPASVSDNPVMWSYRGRYCEYETMACYVTFSEGRLSTIDSFKPEYRDLLDQ